jgi:UDP-glucose 4-epimerase
MVVSKKKILVTGAAGYIGSHTCIELLEAGFDVLALDNLGNSSEESLNRVRSITGQNFPFYKADVRDTEQLNLVLQAHSVDAVIHFAGLKAVGESVEHAHLYYNNNVQGTLMLMKAMMTHRVSRIVFSSSATVYGDPDVVPIDESAPYRPESPYGKSKMMVEQILQDHFHSMQLAGKPWSIATLRYFNPVGAHASGQIGEDPKGVPNNLMPYVAQVAVGKREKLNVFGGDYPTPDGTGVRDYIHVVDLAKGHVAALNHLFAEPTLLEVNLGTGKGSSVLDLVHAFERASGKTIPYEIVARRAGDVPSYYASTQLAEQVLGWQAGLTLDDMCASTWKWQSQNPEGYGKKAE